MRSRPDPPPATKPGWRTGSPRRNQAGLSQVSRAGVVVAVRGGAERRGGGRGGQRVRRDERAALRPGLHRLTGRAPLQVLGPGQEPLGPAVVPLARRGAGGDRDRVTGDGHVVVGLRGGGRQVHAPVTDVGDALVSHRPWGGVIVAAAVGKPDREVDQLVVVAGATYRAA